MSDEENRLLRARLATADNQIERLKQRELELMAQVERLHHGHKAWAKMSDQTYRAGMASLLEETPQQSLAEHDAEAILRAYRYAEVMYDEGVTIGESIEHYCSQLRQQGDKDD